MTERAQKLYDFITEIGDSYLEDARLYQPAAPSGQSRPRWRRWGALAAALVLVLGLSRMAGGLFRMGSQSAAPSTPSAAPSEEPAASAPPPDVPEEPSFNSNSGAGETAPLPGSSYEWNGVVGEGCFLSYAGMAASADTVLIAEASVSSARAEGEYTRLTLELDDVLKGEAKPGETVTLLTPQPFLEGERAVWFLPETDERPVSLERAYVILDGEQALVWSGMLYGQGDGQVWADKEELKAVIRQAVE